MAPPNNRRPGYSRRAQYRIFIGYVVAVFGGLLGLALLIISLVDPTGFAGLRGAAHEVAAPVGRAGGEVRAGGGSAWDNIRAYFNAGSKNARLDREARANRVKLIEAQALRAENLRLKAIVGLIEKQGKPVAVARLIGSTASSTRRFAILGAGRNQGVRVRQPVQSPLGLIGRVLEVGPNSARVLLVTDAEQVIPVRRASDGLAAFAEGRSDGTVFVRLVNVGVNPLKKGDVVVTSGAGGLYRPNIPVAQVQELTSDGAIATILANPAATDFVIVEPVFQPEQSTGLIAVEPKSQPTATPTPAPAPSPSPSASAAPR